MKVVFIMGSEADTSHADTIARHLDELRVEHVRHVASAHKQPLKVLEIVQSYRAEQVVYITIAGRSNALSGFVAANSDKPVIACPPFADKTDMLVNIHSTLQMPSKTPVLTVIDPGNAALAAHRIISFAGGQ
ncbi:MAG: AIR carboxylase family protein [Spirochaetaceae bacterium]|nr:MAG: AIR carboxylase family protein [Spirochaetaceae bacterium]